MNHQELWYVPASNHEQPAESELLFTFPQPAMGIAEVEPDVFQISASDIYTWKESYLYRLDLNRWRPGRAVHPESVLQFPQPVRGLNGSCAIAPDIILLADSWAGLIWRVELHVADRKPKPSVWLEHDSMAYLAMLYYQRIQLPGISGIQYSAKRGCLYYTASAKQLLMRVKADPVSFNPVGEVEILGAADGLMTSGLIKMLVLPTWRATPWIRSIVLLLEASENGSEILSIAGDPVNDELISPSAGHWGRGRSECGRVAFLITDGGTASPPAGGARPSKVMKAEFTTKSTLNH